MREIEREGGRDREKSGREGREGFMGQGETNEGERQREGRRISRNMAN